MWACPSPAPVCDKWMHLAKPEGAREDTQPAPFALRTFFLCFSYFIFEVISPFLNPFYFASLLFHPPQISWLMLWIQLSNFSSWEALQESILSTPPSERLILCLVVMHLGAITWKRSSCWILRSLPGSGACARPSPSWYQLSTMCE